MLLSELEAHNAPEPQGEKRRADVIVNAVRWYRAGARAAARRYSGNGGGVSWVLPGRLNDMGNLAAFKRPLYEQF